MLMTPLYHMLFSQQGRLEKDRELMEQIQLLQWIRPEHLELPEPLEAYADFGQAGQEFTLAHKAACPYEKLQHLLSACKLLYVVLAQVYRDTESASADQFLPALIYLLIRHNPPHLSSNLAYIHAFCSHKSELAGEAAYYITNIRSGVSFIQNLRAADLRIDPEEFDHQMQRQLEPPTVNGLSFVHHSVSDLAVSDVEKLLREYQALATWFIATIDPAETVQVHMPHTRVWGRIKVRAAREISSGEEDTTPDGLFSLVQPPLLDEEFTLSWLRRAVCSCLERDEASLTYLVWLPDVLLHRETDCALLLNALSTHQHVSIEARFSS